MLEKKPAISYLASSAAMVFGVYLSVQSQ